MSLNNGGDCNDVNFHKRLQRIEKFQACNPKLILSNSFNVMVIFSVLFVYILDNLSESNV